MNLETRLPEALWAAVRPNYEKRNFTGAILDAFYFLSELLRTKSGVEGDGAALIGQALGGAAPKIKLNRLQTESEWNIQRGLEQLLRGFYQAVRNPRSHDKVVDSEDEAQTLIIFIGYLVHQLDQAKAQFSRQDFLQRVLDPDFVPQARYAELLVADIPPRLRIDIFLDVYRVKENWKPENVRHFLNALLALLNEDEIKQICEVLSEDLKTSDSDTTVRVILASFSPTLWPKLNEAARLRIENKLIRSVRDGRYDVASGQCRNGSLGTWATNIFAQMTLKDEMISAIANKLWSRNSEDRAYIFQYILESLRALSDVMPASVEAALQARLKAGDDQAHAHLWMSCPWNEDEWTADLKNALSTFKATEPTNDSNDDIPF